MQILLIFILCIMESTSMNPPPFLPPALEQSEKVLQNPQEAWVPGVVSFLSLGAAGGDGHPGTEGGAPQTATPTSISGTFRPLLSPSWGSKGTSG